MMSWMVDIPRHPYIRRANVQHVFAERLCPAVTLPAGTVLLHGAVPYIPDTVLQYECAAGFELTGGQLQRLCRLDGQWTGHSPQCTGRVVKGCHMTSYCYDMC